MIAPVVLLVYAAGAVIFTRRVLTPAVLRPAEERGPLVDAMAYAIAFVCIPFWPVAWIAYIVWSKRNRVD